MTAEIDASATAPAFEATVSPYLIVDRNLCICAVNSAYEAATAHPRSVLLGEQLFDVFPDNPADPNADGVAKASASLETVFRTGARHRMALQRYDVRDRTTPNDFLYKVWVPVNSPIRDDRGRTVAVLHHVQDATEFFPPSPASAAPAPLGQRRWEVLLESVRHQRQVSRDLSQQVETLREALNTNRSISVAIGLLMAATGADRHAAFQLLLKQSQSSNRKLRDIAADLVNQHERRSAHVSELGTPAI